MIETVGLTRHFGGRRAVSDVTATFPAGTVTALLGLNGAGKTTLLRLIAGLDRPDSGTVLVNGRPAGSDPRLLGFHLGPDAMNPRHTVTRHLRWLAALSGVDAARVDTVLADTGLAERRRDRIDRLSLGMRQRVAIAGALLADPQALLFDEPLNGLDVPGIVWFRSLLRRLAEQGRTVVVATHLLGEVALTADRIVLLADGRVTESGDLDTLTPVGADPRDWLESTLLECA
ncbi:ABC transporter family protein [Mycolicibacterium hassiacum DSM 44199]|jgi:ABC-2 type transport system ATP-binding protein|uniref:ABC transporter family protein n=1 Tax=Mycolicibacterium hassiacum (strain DSM 44199 / CIP 105218 / JCM 12690 / 3849) TaxID=1122247 RepID=K5BH08_MYCHD|nr:ABC transporter ATP-binding protein [Mycolicibacterium hassiacum]EKF25237.1 ABC transporter family protein [Mycolicibacterium hassiacum DSM 44199]MBX5487379.1 ABC transporter ATP-binding protein [Mycolicibacterium hassiacum]MDA4088031.1 multidrug ABC transporter ATPase [Mycolicibacterium hassiacum DSM 44199]VCT89189.1 ABC transporter ATP-binding protein NatA [Mycolicibacterium hassiacum DSM 44199]